MVKLINPLIPNAFVDVILHRKDSLRTLAHWFCVSRNGGTGGDGWGHLQGDLHMVAVVDVCRNALVGTGWSNSCLVCTNGLRKHCSHLVESSFLAVKAFSALNGCLLAENAD